MSYTRRIVLILACLFAAGAAQAEDFRENKVYCAVAYDAKTVAVKPEWKDKDLSYSQCAREVRNYKAFLKTLDATSNIGVWASGCTTYCGGVYPRAKFLRGLE